MLTIQNSPFESIIINLYLAGLVGRALELHAMAAADSQSCEQIYATFFSPTCAHSHLFVCCYAVWFVTRKSMVQNPSEFNICSFDYLFVVCLCVCERAMSESLWCVVLLFVFVLHTCIIEAEIALA